MLYLGNDLKERKKKIKFSSEHSRAILICGKRGTGKSYTLGVLAEELMLNHNALVVIIDPIGIYWSMHFPADEAQQNYHFKVQVLIPGDITKQYDTKTLAKMKEQGIAYRSIEINPSDLSPDAWCALFDLNINVPLGIALYRAVLDTSKRRRKYNLSDLARTIKKDPKLNPSTIKALENRLDIAKRWEIFSSEYQPTWDTLSPEKINILDLSSVPAGEKSIRTLLVSLLCQNLMTQRTQDRRKEALSLARKIPPVWLLVDEAHQFIPRKADALSSEVLIKWVKEGRQPGLSLALASQQPASLSQEVLSQCDSLIAHKLTLSNDIQAINKLTQTYMQGELGLYIKAVKNPGEAILWDDLEERISLIKVRKRLTKHEGKERCLETKERQEQKG